jgi:hypothetical protein
MSLLNTRELSYSSKKLNSWKLKELKLLANVELMKLKEEIYSREQLRIREFGQKEK